EYHLSVIKMVEFDKVLSRNKIYAHPERLIEWMKTGITLPITVEIDPTNKCNLNCPNCTGNRTFPDAELSYTDMKTIIDKISCFIKGIVFTGGGEPLINPHTQKAIRYAHKKQISIGLITNGSLVHTVNLKQLVSSCEWIRISINKENTKKIFENISKLVKTRNQHATKCDIGVAHLTSGEGKKELEKLAKEAKSLGVDYIQFRPYHHVNNNIIERIEEVKNLETENFKVIYPKGKYEKKNFKYKQAFADEFRFVVNATGDIYPDCFTRGLPGFSYGNLLEQPFEEIWNSKRRRKILECKLQQKNCPEQCKQDELNQLLWLMHCSKEESEHKNFV
ncbi:MAG: radical SAM protein, partial [Nanoarchaeota archaeon]|nr:radical SAM protein [Nanoarchaeota archaeon]